MMVKDLPPLPPRSLYGPKPKVGAGVALKSNAHPIGKRTRARLDPKSIEVVELPAPLVSAGALTIKSAPKVERIAVAKEAVEKAKRGRPKADKPWVAAGVSRMTWYRRQKKDAAR
jgi:short-subunit dehydrogenase involved in D-alanine esterification of teichoic acids